LWDHKSHNVHFNFNFDTNVKSAFQYYAIYFEKWTHETNIEEVPASLDKNNWNRIIIRFHDFLVIAPRSAGIRKIVIVLMVS